MKEIENCPICLGAGEMYSEKDAQKWPCGFCKGTGKEEPNEVPELNTLYPHDKEYLAEINSVIDSMDEVDRKFIPVDNPHWLDGYQNGYILGRRKQSDPAHIADIVRQTLYIIATNKLMDGIDNLLQFERHEAILAMHPEIVNQIIKK